jgi:NAD(P)-dependent dehydrogenase (short-subunit alcohol dehydrogenase family)
LIPDRRRIGDPNDDRSHNGRYRGNRQDRIWGVKASRRPEEGKRVIIFRDMGTLAGREDEQVAAAFARVVQEAGAIDILVNNVWGGYERMEKTVATSLMACPKQRPTK